MKGRGRGRDPCQEQELSEDDSCYMKPKHHKSCDEEDKEGLCKTLRNRLTCVPVEKIPCIEEESEGAECRFSYNVGTDDEIEVSGVCQEREERGRRRGGGGSRRRGREPRLFCNECANAQVDDSCTVRGGRTGSCQPDIDSSEEDDGTAILKCEATE